MKKIHEWDKRNEMPRFLSYCINRWMGAGNRFSTWFWFKLLMWSDRRWRNK